MKKIKADAGIPQSDTGSMQRAGTALAYCIGGARMFFEGWFHGYIMWVVEMWFDALVVDWLRDKDTNQY